MFYDVPYVHIETGKVSSCYYPYELLQTMRGHMSARVHIHGMGSVAAVTTYLIYYSRQYSVAVLLFPSHITNKALAL